MNLPTSLRQLRVSDVMWTCQVFLSRWRCRLTYALAAPVVYRNWWALALSMLGTPIVLELRCGLRFHIRPGSGDLGVVNEAFILNPYLGGGHIDVPDHGVVMDIGANIGDFSLQVAQRCPTGRVIAVEPLPSRSAAHVAGCISQAADPVRDSRTLASTAALSPLAGYRIEQAA